MPESKKRAKADKAVYKAPRKIKEEKTSENPKWLVPAFSTMLILGVAWILVAYISRAQYPLDIGNWNLGIGFGLLTAGMMTLSVWK